MRAFNNWSLQKKLLFVPMVTCTLLVVMGVIMYIGTAKNGKAVYSMYNQSRDIQSQNQILNNLINIHGNIYKSLTWRNLGYEDKRIDSLVKAQLSTIDTLHILFKSSTQKSIDYKFFKDLDTQLIQYRDWIIKAEDMAESDLTIASTFMKPAENLLQEMNSQCNKELEEVLHKSDSYYASVKLSNVNMLIISIVVLIFALLITVILSSGITRIITKQIGSIISIADSLAKGDLTKEVSVQSTDEIGRIGLAVNNILHGLKDIVQNIYSKSSFLRTSAHTLDTSSKSLNSISSEMDKRSGRVSTSTQQTSENIQTIAASAEEMSTSVHTIASAAGQIRQSLNEISKNCQEEEKMTAGAEQHTYKTRETMEKLDNASKTIGKIITIIEDIADKTRLLALNATIEAASAGEAGRGFAVVANEVKSLAHQTAQATVDIRNQITQIQTNTATSLNSINDLSTIIESIHNISSSIAAAVEQQSSAMNEVSTSVENASIAATDIAHHVSSSAEELKEISDNMIIISNSIKETNIEASDVGRSTEQLLTLSNDLQSAVGKFQIDR